MQQNLNDRSGSVRIRQGKGLKAREVPLNATARRALKQYLEHRQAPGKSAALFISSRETAMQVRTIQSVITSIARRARLKRVAVSAHTLRHTFALGYLRDNPGRLLELAGLLGHEFLDTTMVYTRPSRDDLAADLERSHLCRWLISLQQQPVLAAVFPFQLILERTSFPPLEFNPG